MMKIMKIKDALKIRFYKFVENTSLQGIREAVHARTTNAKAFWFVIIIVAYSLSSYQIYQAAFPNDDNSVNSRIEVLKHGRLFYPPLTLCYSPWIQWLDFSKTNEFHDFDNSIPVTRDILYGGAALKYAISFIFDVYATTDFDETEAESQLRAYIFDNTTTMEKVIPFLQSVAFDFPPGMTGLDDLKFGLPYVKGNKLCYDGDINEYLNNRNIDIEENVNLKKKRVHLFFNSKLYLQMGYDSNETMTYTRDIFRMDESVPVSKQCLTRYMDMMNEFAYVRFPSSVEILQDGSALTPHPMFSEYEVKVHSKVRRWKNTKSSPCIEGEQSFPCSTGCVENCIKRKAVCTNCVERLSSETSFFSQPRRCMLSLNQTSTIPIFLTSKKPCIKNISNNNTACKTSTTSAYLPSCSSKECLIKGCEVWYLETTEKITPIFESTCNESSFNISITIVYPLEESIFVSVESDEGKQLYNIMSKVGGILAVWLGASILSLVHMAYVFCDCNKPDIRPSGELQMQPDQNNVHLQPKQQLHQSLPVNHVHAK